MKKIFSIETSSEAEWAAVLKIIQESFDDKYFTEFEILIPYRIYNSNAFNEWLEELMRVCRVNNSYRFWRFDEHISTCDTSYRRIIFRKAVNDEDEKTLEETYKFLNTSNGALQSHCENQRKEINLLLKQKNKLKKELEECKNSQVDMLAYRDDIIGKISREKNKLENANKSQTRYIEKLLENIKKGNEQYNKLKEDYKALYDRKLKNAVKEYDELKNNYYILEEAYKKLDARYNGEKENWSEKYGELQDSINLKNRRIASLEQGTKTQSDVINHKNSEICYLKSEIEKWKEACLRHQVDVNNFQGAYTEATERVNALKENIEHLERENEHLRELYSCTVESSKKIIDRLRKEKKDD